MLQFEHESPQSNKLNSATTDYSTIYTHPNTQHAKALQSALCKRKAMIHVSEEMKTKASDLDRLAEQIRQKQTLGSIEKIKIFTLTIESWSISH